MFEHGFKLLDEVREASNRDSSSREGTLSESGCPGEGGSFGHVRQGKGNLLVVVIIYFLINK